MLCARGLPCPEPGIHENIPFDEYVQWDAVSNSQLSLLEESPRHYRMGHSGESTPNQQLCELRHCGVLEPKAVAQRYVIRPKFEHDIANTTASGEPSTSKATKYVKQKDKEFEEQHTDKLIVSSEEYEETFSLVEQYYENEEARRILNGPGHSELSIVWDQCVVMAEVYAAGKVEKIRCKARLDRVSIEHGIIADLKGTSKPLSRFDREIASYSYHRQLAGYVDGWEAITGERFQPWIIVHEMKAPFTVLAAPLDEVAWIVGRDERYKLLRRLVECRRTDHWPGPPNPSSWQLPAWAIPAESMIAAGGEEI